jgi:DUF1680 family protein
MLSGLVVLAGVSRDADANGTRDRPFVAVPSFAWANRGLGEMLLWIRH